MAKQKQWPKVKETIISREPFTEKILDSKGRRRTIKGETQTTVAIPAEILYKLGPMIYVCKENKKVYFIPFTIQFSFEEFLKWLVGVHKKLEEIATAWAEEEDQKPEDKPKTN